MLHKSWPLLQNIVNRNGAIPYIWCTQQIDIRDLITLVGSATFQEFFLTPTGRSDEQLGTVSANILPYWYTSGHDIHSRLSLNFWQKGSQSHQPTLCCTDLMMVRNCSSEEMHHSNIHTFQFEYYSNFLTFPRHCNLGEHNSVWVQHR